MNQKRLSKFISYILRHHPEAVCIELDEHGWASVDELIERIKMADDSYSALNRDILDEIVKQDSKQRYSYNEDGTLIRANQGHSIPVDVELEEKEPPEFCTMEQELNH